MDILKSTGYAAIPWVFATLSDLLIGGVLFDHLIARGFEETRVRETILVAGAVLVIGIVAYIFVLGRIEPVPQPAAAAIMAPRRPS